jgi:hypothetical protein
MGVFDEGLAAQAALQNGFVAPKDTPGSNPSAAAGS